MKDPLGNLQSGNRLLPEVTGRATEPTWFDLSGTPTAINWLKHSKPEEPEALDLLKTKIVITLVHEPWASSK